VTDKSERIHPLLFQTCLEAVGILKTIPDLCWRGRFSKAGKVEKIHAVFMGKELSHRPEGL
jgi:hypothetical protein